MATPFSSYAFEPPEITKTTHLPNESEIILGKTPFPIDIMDHYVAIPQVSGNGKLVSLSDINNGASFYSGDNWENNATIRSKWGKSRIDALSYDGNVAVSSAGEIYKDQNWSAVITVPQKGTIFRAVSSDGKFLGGLSNNKLDATTWSQATIWSGEKWQNAQILKSLYIDNLGSSAVTALSSEGSVAAGWVGKGYSNEVFAKRAVLWYGNNWENIIDLGTLDNNAAWPTNFDNKEVLDSNIQYYSTVNALSANGSVAAGRTWNGNLSNTRGIVWSGNEWKDKKDLGTLKADNSGLSGAYAISTDGQVIAGEAETDFGQNITHAVIWSTDSNGNPWALKTDLGTLNNDDKTLISAAYSISADGSVVAGLSTTGEVGQYGELKQKPILWKIKYYAEVPDTSLQEEVTEWKPVTYVPTEAPKQEALPEGVPPGPTTPPKPATEPPVVTAIIDVENTQQALFQMGHDTFELFSLQFGALRRLQEECVAGKGEICYALQHNYTAQNGNYDNAVNLRVGYGFTDNLTFGVNFDRSLRRSLPDTYRRLSGNGGVGVFGHYQLPYHAYIAAGIGWDYYRVQAQRPLLANTEFAPTKSRVRGLAWNVTVGQDFTLANNSQLGWYLAYRQTEIKRDGYRENVPGFPVEYSAANLKDNALAVGAKFALPITPKLSWISAVEFERRLGGESPVYSAKAQYVGDMRYQPDLNHSRWNAQSGLRYAFVPNLSLSLTPFWGNSIVGNNQWGTKLTLEGKF